MRNPTCHARLSGRTVVSTAAVRKLSVATASAGPCVEFLALARGYRGGGNWVTEAAVETESIGRKVGKGLGWGLLGNVATRVFSFTTSQPMTAFQTRNTATMSTTIEQRALHWFTPTSDISRPPSLL